MFRNTFLLQQTVNFFTIWITIGLLKQILWHQDPVPKIARTILQKNSNISDAVLSDNRIYRIKFSIPIVWNNSSLIYTGFRIYRMNSAVGRDPIYPRFTEYTTYYSAVDCFVMLETIRRKLIVFRIDRKDSSNPWFHLDNLLRVN